jgi:DNA-binding Lrp family transcriptional regulator
VADPVQHEGAGGDAGAAEGNQAWVGLMQAEDRPAGQLTQDEQPGSSRDAGEVRSGPPAAPWPAPAGPTQIPEVRHAERLFGDPDYLLRVATADIAAYQTLRDTQLATLPGVGRLTSTIVMKRVVEDRPYPLAPPAPRPKR